MKRASIIIPAVLAVAALARIPDAYAIDASHWLVYCVGNDPNITKQVHEAMATTCDVKVGNKSKCSKTGGTPWLCSKPVADSSPDQPGEDDWFCGYKVLSISFEAGTKLPGDAWTVKTAASIKFTSSGHKNIKGTCEPEPKDPQVQGNGGTFVDESGSMLVETTWVVTGELSLTGPGGVTVFMKGKGECENATSFKYFSEQEVNQCACATTAVTDVASATAETEPETCTAEWGVEDPDPVFPEDEGWDDDDDVDPPTHEDDPIDEPTNPIEPTDPGDSTDPTDPADPIDPADPETHADAP